MRPAGPPRSGDGGGPRRHALTFILNPRRREQAALGKYPKRWLFKLVLEPPGGMHTQCPNSCPDFSPQA